MQWLSRQPDVILDVAHNPQSARYLASQLIKLKGNYSRCIALVGMLKDKDIRQALLPLTSVFDQWHLVTLGGARGALAQQLADNLDGLAANLGLHDDVYLAYQKIVAELKPDELLVVFGSFFTVSAVLAGHQEAK